MVDKRSWSVMGHLLGGWVRLVADGVETVGFGRRGRGAPAENECEDPG